MIIKLFSFQEDNPTYAESLAFLQKSFPAESNCCRKYFLQKAVSEEIFCAEKSFLTIKSIFCRKHFLNLNLPGGLGVGGDYSFFTGLPIGPRLSKF